LAAPERERDAVNDVRPPLVRPEVDREAVDLDERRVGGSTRGCGVHGVRVTERPSTRATPSVTRLRLITSTARAPAGASTLSGAVTIATRFSLIISPHSGDGGCAPKPRKPSELIRIGA